MKKIQKEIFLIASLPSLVIVVFALASAMPENGRLSPVLVISFILLSIAATLYLGYQIQSKLINPLEETISGLYQKTHAGSGTDKLRELSLALDTYISHLEQDFEDKQEKLTNESSTLQKKVAELEQQHSALLDSFKSLDKDASSDALVATALRELCLTTLKNIIGFTNRINNAGTISGMSDPVPGSTHFHTSSTDFNRCLGEITQAARSLVFLIQEAGNIWPASDKCDVDPWQIADDTLELLDPLINRPGCNVSVRISKSCPTMLNVTIGELRCALFHYLLHYFLHNQFLTTQEQNPDLALEVTFSAENRLIFAIADESYPSSYPSMTKASARLLQLTRQGMTLENGSLCVPAKAVTVSQELPGKNLTGIVICESILQRQSLHARLTQLGVQVVDDFKTTKLDLCIVDDETGEAFKAVQPYLKPDLNLFLLNNKTLYQRQNWHQLRRPLDQNELKQLLKTIEPTVQQYQNHEVLIVDDNEANLRLLELQLQELGHSVTKATDGREAVDLCNQHQFDLIFLDIQLPGIDGIEVTRIIRERQAIAPPIVGLTAHATREERQSYLEAGMSEVVLKPIRMEKLKTVLYRQINLPDAKPALPAARIQELSLFDHSSSLSVANKRPALAAEFLQILISNLPADRDQINRAFRTRDSTALKASVHKLNGAVKYCGVPRLANAIDKLESIVKTSSEDHARRALDLLNGEIGSLLSWYGENPEPFGKQPGSAENT